MDTTEKESQFHENSKRYQTCPEIRFIKDILLRKNTQELLKPFLSKFYPKQEPNHIDSPSVFFL